MSEIDGRERTDNLTARHAPGYYLVIGKVLKGVNVQRSGRPDSQPNCVIMCSHLPVQSATFPRLSSDFRRSCRRVVPCLNGRGEQLGDHFTNRNRRSITQIQTSRRNRVAELPERLVRAWEETSIDNRVARRRTAGLRDACSCVKNDPTVHQSENKLWNKLWNKDRNSGDIYRYLTASKCSTKIRRTEQRLDNNGAIMLRHKLGLHFPKLCANYRIATV